MLLVRRRVADVLCVGSYQWTLLALCGFGEHIIRSTSLKLI